MGMPAAAVLLLNNYRDLESDRASGRRTLCHYLGRDGARRLYAVLLLLPVAILLLAPLPGMGWPVLLAIPLALVLNSRLRQGVVGQALNPLLAATAAYELALVMLIVVGFVLGRGA